jgi:hypothetical protein
MFHGLLARDRQILAFSVGLALTTGICQSPPSEHDIVKVVTNVMRRGTFARRIRPESLRITPYVLAHVQD